VAGRLSDDRVPNIVAIGDTHFGCKLALCPREGFSLDEGGTYNPSLWQQVLCDWWDEFWDDFVPTATRGEPFVLVHVGDGIDGDHHDTSTIFTRNPHDQVLMAAQMMRPVVARARKLFWIRGTGVHIGKSAEHEESLAQMLGAVRNDDGRHTRQELTLDLGGRRINFMHHIGTSSSPFAQSGALQRLAVRSYVETGRRGDQPYAMIVRGHRHQHSAITEEAAHGKVTVVTTPAWQGKTPYVYSRDGLQMTQPEIGGIVIRLADDELFTRAFVRRPDPPKAVAI